MWSGIVFLRFTMFRNKDRKPFFKYYCPEISVNYICHINKHFFFNLIKHPTINLKLLKLQLSAQSNPHSFWVSYRTKQPYFQSDIPVPDLRSDQRRVRKAWCQHSGDTIGEILRLTLITAGRHLKWEGPYQSRDEEKSGHCAYQRVL